MQLRQSDYDTTTITLVYNSATTCVSVLYYTVVEWHTWRSSILTESLLSRFRTVVLREDLPGRWNDELDLFQKILVLRCLRPDKVTNAMQDFVSENLGQKFIEPQSADLGLVFHDSSPATPLIFVLSVGTDPAAGLYKFAEEMKFSKKLSAISLGQGQACRLCLFSFKEWCWPNISTYSDSFRFLERIGRISLLLIPRCSVHLFGQKKTSHKLRFSSSFYIFLFLVTC